MPASGPAGPEGDTQGPRTAPADDWASGWRRTIKRTRLWLLISVTAAQVILAVILWRVKVGRVRREGQPLELE